MQVPDRTAHGPIVQSPAEEVVNALTHGIGAALGVAGLVVLVVVSAGMDDAWRVVSTALYGATLVQLYLASTLYHAVRNPRAKRVLQVIDHAAIYLLIAGTYTPFTLVTLRGPWGWAVFGVIWGCAAAGIAVQALFPGRFRALLTGLYVAMGWMMVVAIVPLVQRLDAGGLAWLVAGGVGYTGGVFFYAKRWFPFSHGVWHLFVLAGSACHYFAILDHVVAPGG
jgi:hemolysin III